MEAMKTVTESRLSAAQHNSISEEVRTRAEEFRKEERFYRSTNKIRSTEQPITSVRKPPAANGMLDCLQHLERVTYSERCLSKEYAQAIPSTIKRIGFLLKMFYDAIINNITPPTRAEQACCDLQDSADYCVRLFAIGEFLRLHPTRLFAVLSTEQDLLSLLFEGDIGHADVHGQATTLNSKTRNSKPPIKAMHLVEDKLHLSIHHRAAHIFGTLIGSLLITIILCLKPNTPGADALISASYRRLVEFSVSVEVERASGQIICRLLEPSIFKSVQMTNELLAFGGLPNIFLGWCTYSRGLNETNYSAAIRRLPLEIWMSVSLDTVLRIIDILIERIEDDKKQDRRSENHLPGCPTLCPLLYGIYLFHGLEPFRIAARRSFFSTFFPFIYNRLRRNPERFEEIKDWDYLVVDKWANCPKAVMRRYTWHHTAIVDQRQPQQLDNLTCDNPNCSEESRFRSLSKRIPAWDKDLSEELDKWGREHKMCGEGHKAASGHCIAVEGVKLPIGRFTRKSVKKKSIRGLGPRGTLKRSPHESSRVWKTTIASFWIMKWIDPTEYCLWRNKQSAITIIVQL